MINLIDEFGIDLVAGKYLVVLPISRFVIENEFTIGKFAFYPSGAVDIDGLRTVRNKSIDDFNSDIVELEGQDLREVSTSITGVSIDVYKRNTLIAFTIELEWNEFLLADHSYDLKLIQKVTQEASKVMDLIRFYFCRADLIDSMPGHIGTWEGSNGFTTALLYTIGDHESYIIAGSVISHTVVKGLGLELNDYQTHDLNDMYSDFIESNAEVSSIAKLALSMNTDFLESNNPTTKFVRALTLLEYLAYPDKYEVFPEVKKQISIHRAKNNQEYHSLKDRFFELTGKRDPVTKEHVGYRTRIVHMGHNLEDILDNDESKIKRLMLELQGYIGIVIEHMIQNRQMTWEEFGEFRRQRRFVLGLQKDD